MKTGTFKIVSALFFGLLLFAACGKDKPLTAETQTAADSLAAPQGAVYVVDTMNSKIEWKGFKVIRTDNMSHFGTLKFESGEVTVKDGELQSGKFVADMSSLTSTDLKDNPEDLNKLIGHLKSEDFFNVEKFPTASYEITQATKNTSGDYNTALEGNLTVKGITKPVRFLANVTVKDGEISIATEPTDISRADYGVKFQMPVANGIIKDEVNLQILIKALEQK